MRNRSPPTLLLSRRFFFFLDQRRTRQISIKDRFNATNLKSLTTQAPINVEDLTTWNKNGFGNTIFGLIPSLSYERSLEKKDAGDLHIGIVPPATIILPDNANSTRITAVDLPTKTARPYQF